MACNHNCSSCSKKKDGSCGEAKDFLAKSNPGSNVKKVIAVMSGKGGVGKSLVTELLAVAAMRKGLKTAVLDADITGPSIPMAFGVTERAVSDGTNIMPCRSKCGLGVMSLNLVVEDPRDPVIWRGPVLAGVVTQFWSDVAWGDVDIMFVDMPPGTGDVPLTVFQSLPVDGIVVVTSPQDVVGMIVEKALRMAKMMSVPVLGIVENMAVFKCPDCGKEHRIFGEGRTAALAAENGIANVVSLPINPGFAKAVDAGEIESVEETSLDPILEACVSAAGKTQKT
jgi:Mrp family chromosome partitioning ATPase